MPFNSLLNSISRQRNVRLEAHPHVSFSYSTFLEQLE